MWVFPFFYALDAFCEVNNQRVEALRGQVEDEDEEDSQVALPDAIVNPAAMVVHSEHAAPAFTAMVRTRRLDTLALKAESHELLLQVLDLLVCECQVARFRTLFQQ